MAFYLGPTQISVDPESTVAAIQAGTAQLMLTGTRVAKNGRVYLYVLCDASATPPAKGGLMYVLSAATFKAGSYSVTNGANALTTNANFAIGAGFATVLALTAGDWGFVQVRGDAFSNVSATLTGVNAGAQLASNLTNAANPERAILATTTNIVLTNTVGTALSAGAANAVPCLIDVAGV